MGTIIAGKGRCKPPCPRPAPAVASSPRKSAGAGQKASAAAARRRANNIANMARRNALLLGAVAPMSALSTFAATFSIFCPSVGDLSESMDRILLLTSFQCQEAKVFRLPARLRALYGKPRSNQPWRSRVRKRLASVQKALVIWNRNMATATRDILPPGPGTGFARSLLGFRRDPLGFLMSLASRYGDVVYFRLVGPQGIYLINNPEYIKDILVTNSRNFTKSRGLEVAKRFLGEGLLTSEGEFHRRQRRLAQPAFHQQRIDSYGAAMVDYANRLSERWHDNQTVDMAEEMMKLTLSVVSKTLFDADVESEAGEIREALTEIMHVFRFGLTLPFGDKIEKILVFPRIRFQRAKARLDAIIYRIISERRASGIDRGDLLSMLLMSQDEQVQEGMTDQQVRDEAMTLFLAGHETTANALTWTWYLISQYPEVERRLHAELDSVLAGDIPTAEDVRRLPYTESILAEAMRLYPPAWVTGRRAIADYQIGDYLIPAGSIRTGGLQKLGRAARSSLTTHLEAAHASA